MNGISIFISVSYSPIWGYKKQAYYHPEGDPHQNPTMLAPWPRSSSPWNCENTFVLFTSHQSVVLCYSSPNWLKQVASKKHRETSLVVQWLRLLDSNAAWEQGWSLGGNHRPWPKKKERKRSIDSRRQIPHCMSDWVHRTVSSSGNNSLRWTLTTQNYTM